LTFTEQYNYKVNLDTDLFYIYRVCSVGACTWIQWWNVTTCVCWSTATLRPLPSWRLVHISRRLWKSQG